jgi:hypothetical protein
MTDAFGRKYTNNPNSFNLSYTNANAKSSNNGNANETITYFYTSSNNVISPHALGQIRYNNLDQTKATQIHISYTTNDAIDVKEFLLKLSPQTKIYIQDKLNSTSYIEYIAGTIIDNGTFTTINVSVLRSSFADVNNFANLLEVIIKTTITR